MTTNTVHLNQQLSLAEYQSVWLFGYGSLIFKVDFPYLEKRVASITGWERRFWQGSHDHRGTPDKPGRVVTLTAVEQAQCVGMAYRVAPQTFKQLDEREKNGYLRLFVPLQFANSEHPSAEALVYIAGPDNAAFMGEAPIDEIAAQIAASHGPSGGNAEYLFELDKALLALGQEDPHVHTLSLKVRALL